jgi:iron complex outermembrane receptor protein
MFPVPIRASLLLLLVGSTGTIAQEVVLDPIVVGADFHQKRLSETTTSLALVSEDGLYDKSSQDFEEVVGQVPNVNFSSGASRAHHIQIRGVGERSQFATPINPSVGIFIDGVDYSQSSLGVTLFDTKQIEVLKGPQGTTFGATGMAGVVNIQSNPPTEELEGHIETTLGDYNTYAYGMVLSGSIVDHLLEGRFSLYKYLSDGYMKNAFLKREDTQNIDELTTKLQLRWYVGDNHTIDLDWRHLYVDNGYDAFTLDNSRISYADEVGSDRQKSDAFALTSHYRVSDAMRLLSTITYSNTTSLYSYDEDWSYVGAFDPSLSPYSAFDSYGRERQQIDMDLKLIGDIDGRIFEESTDWTLGVYHKRYEEDLRRDYTYFSTPFQSDYETQSSAIYGQLDTALSDKLTMVSGLRVEWWHSRYSDSEEVEIDYDEPLWGGKWGFNYQESPNLLYYSYLSKGYKAGGVNSDPTLISEAKSYDTESLWSLELGINSNHFEDTLINRLNLFYGKRADQQVQSSVVTPREDGSTNFVGYLANAGQSHYYGLESQLDWYPNAWVHLYSSVGLLYASFDRYEDPNPLALDMRGRTPAHSPEYQYLLGIDMTFWEGWIWKANIESKGEYYFSNRHHAKSDPYTLLHSSLEYTVGSWSVVAWMRNITNEAYETRGFGSFGNNPAKGYRVEEYTQQGLPRRAGVTLSYDF